MRRALHLVVLAGLALGLTFTNRAHVRAEEPAPTDAEALFASVAPTVVSLRFTVAITFSMAGQVGSHRMTSQARATVVDPSGLLMTSDSETAGPRSPMVAAVESMLPGIELKLEVEELRVVLGEGGEELPGLLVVRDGRNDLAWVQVLELGERRLPAVDLAAGREPRVGEELASVTRIGRGFGYAALYTKGRVSSFADRPRRSWDIATDASEAGLLYFAPTGAPLGLHSYLPPTEGTAGGKPGRRLLPLDVVRKSLDAAKKRLPEVLEKARLTKLPEVAEEPEVPKEPSPPKEPAGR